MRNGDAIEANAVSQRRSQETAVERPESAADDGREVMSVNEVARALDISRSLTYMSLRDGTIPAKRIRGRWVVPRERFTRWLNHEDD